MLRQQGSIDIQKKSKSRGNRPLQRFRSKCRARGLDDDSIRNLLFGHPSRLAPNVHMTDETKHNVKDDEIDKTLTNSFHQNHRESTEDMAPIMSQVR